LARATEPVDNKIAKDKATDDIILDIIPLLKNGITPEKQTIINVLITVAEEYETNKWRLKQTGQLSFNF